MAGTDLPRRLAVAAVGVPVGIGVTYLGSWPVAVAVSLVAAVGTQEVFRLAGARGWRPFAWMGVPAAALLVLGAAWGQGFGEWAGFAWGVVLALTFGTLVLALFTRGANGDPLLAVAITLFGAIYLGATLSFAVHLRGYPGGEGGAPGWSGALILVFPFAVTWLGDTMAYLAGHRWGRRKLLPAVSPGKTIEGGIGGLVGATGGAALFAWLLLLPFTPLGLSVPAAAVLGLVIGAVAQLADLAESLLKREAGVKDSGSLFPGHGGILDRFDAILFTLPVTYVLLPFFVS
ncbi:MAG: phosphatidate cytidylyltransferase [Gemmatimonadota bacterium]